MVCIEGQCSPACGFVYCLPVNTDPFLPPYHITNDLLHQVLFNFIAVFIHVEENTNPSRVYDGQMGYIPAYDNIQMKFMVHGDEFPIAFNANPNS